MYQWLLSIAVKVNWNKTYLKYQPNEDNRNIKVKQMTTENRKEFWSSFSMANSVLQSWGHVLYIVQVVFQLKEDEQRFTAEIKRSNRSQNKTKVLFNNSFAFCPQITRPLKKQIYKHYCIYECTTIHWRLSSVSTHLNHIHHTNVHMKSKD